ncbi:energy transducer TonB [Desulfovibrio sp. DV]|uniref:energy transducer TonB n=1 Tax=Desulfovibrio sp. DV TaxID=1844708 RepID=UPI0020C9E140|nr:energy transducer TonB [Desulfovibrio sp. DV]
MHRPSPVATAQTSGLPSLEMAALRDWALARPTAGTQWWPWLLASVALHGLVAAALVVCALVAGPAPEPPLTVIGHMDLGGLDGGGPAGGDGQDSGLDGAAREPAVAAPAESPPAAQGTVTRTETGPPAEPAAQPIPEPTAAPAPPPLTPPAKQPATPKARPKTLAAKAQPAGPPPIQPATAEAGHVSDTGTGSGANAGEGSGQGLSGEGPGKGLTPGAGPGGNGDGRGNGGMYVGEFGRGDGPRFRHRSPLRYPDAAKRTGQEGKVRLRLEIDAEGVLRNVSVMEHTGLEFVEEALRAIRSSTYYPAMRQGRPEACNALLTIRFALG